jgi:hypothetical protein
MMTKKFARIQSASLREAIDEALKHQDRRAADSD